MRPPKGGFSKADRLMMFFRHVQPGKGRGACWEWTGCQTSTGYGRFMVNRRGGPASRAAYTLLIGEIPVGLTIDHLCRNPSCVNPRHLEAVSMRENLMRGGSPSAHNARKILCKNGHKFDRRVFNKTKGSYMRQCSVCCGRRAKLWRKKNA